VAFVADLGLLHPQILSLEAVPFKGGGSAGMCELMRFAATRGKTK